jgi:ATP adenylyltransferase
MIFPARHVEDPRELDAEEHAHLARLQNLTLDVIGREYGAAGFNVGYNIGTAAGASIAHLHLHVVPRFSRELGVVDILSGAKIIIEDPEETRRRLRAAFGEALKKSRG